MSMHRRNKQDDDSGLIEKLLHVNRVAKVVKGGRRFSFSAIVVVGDGEGQVGLAHGKAKEVPEAIRKATERARGGMFAVPLVARTIPHEVRGRFSAGQVMLRPASAGTGVIAGPMVRSILEAAGVHDALTKSLGSANPHNLCKATIKALEMLESPDQYAVRVDQPKERIKEYYALREWAWGDSDEVNA